MSAAPSPEARNEALVVDLGDLGKSDLPRAGGKGANLGELIRGGFPVPPGFVITSEAFRGAMASLGGRERLEGGRVPDALWKEISARYRQLGAGLVAVRSSATAEDLPGATFAGQHTTLLQVSGEEALERAVRACWGSLWSEHAVDYRRHQGVDGGEVAMAVVVQRMVQPACAGVMFTADPISSSRSVVAIEAAPGLGEAVVSGSVTPERVVVDKARKAVVERRAGRFTEDQAPSQAPVVTDAQARELAELAVSVERHFGGPQDIEWAIAEGRTVLLQARPMTALRPEDTASHPPAPPPASAAPRRMRPKDMARQIAGELFPMRPYPLDISAHTLPVLDGIFRNMFKPLGVGVRPVSEMFVQEDGVLLRLSEFGPRPSWRLLYRPFLNAWRQRRYSLEGWESDAILTEGLERARALRARDLAALDWVGVVQTMEEGVALAPHMALLRGRYFPQAILWIALYWLMLAAARRFRTEIREALGTGIRTKTLEANDELEALAALVRGDPALAEVFRTSMAPELARRLRAGELPAGFQRRFESFLDRFGSRETSVTMVTRPAWWNAPEIPLALVQSLSAGEPSRRTAEGPQAWERARDELLGSTFLGRWPFRRLFLRALAGRRLAYQLRENSHLYVMAGQGVAHACIQELGRRLAKAGVLESEEDVVHLVMPELRQAWPPSEEGTKALREAVERRKRRREALGAWAAHPPEAKAPLEAGVLLSGLPGSPGTAEGPARVILGPHQFGELRQGDVLVCPYTNPSWTPLFHRAAAVVADWGGANSHAAIVAREYGVPAVMGTGDGTKKLTTGQRVRVDGTAGRVYPVG